MNFFSDNELHTLKNSEFLHIKNKVLDKIRNKLSETGQKLVKEIKSDFPDIHKRFSRESPKVSKGENYHGLPYMVLDYPRFFEKGYTFSFRITFLWGHYLNCSLHVEGNMIDIHSMEKRWATISKQQVYVCIHSSPWEHYLTDPYFKLSSSMDVNEFKDHFEKNHFIKIASRLEFDQMKNLPDLAIGEFKSLLQFLEPNLPE